MLYLATAPRLSSFEMTRATPSPKQSTRRAHRTVTPKTPNQSARGSDLTTTTTTTTARARASERASERASAPARAVVRVEALRRAVVRDDHVVAHVIHLRRVRRRAARVLIVHVREERVAVPRVYRPVVAALAALVEDEVVRHLAKRGARSQWRRMRVRTPPC